MAEGRVIKGEFKTVVDMLIRSIKVGGRGIGKVVGKEGARGRMRRDGNRGSG